MKNYIMLIFTFLLMSTIWSCDIMKESTKNKRETDLEQMNESSRRRKGDTVVFIPQFNVKYIDTTIYTVNREGTTLRTVYNSQGNVQSIECMASTIEEMNRNWLKLLESEKDKTQKKEENFDSSFVLYLVIGLIVIVCFGMFLMFRTVNQHGAILKKITDKFELT